MFGLKSINYDGSNYIEYSYNRMTGRVRILKNFNNNWIQMGQDLIGDSEYIHFGKSISLNSDGTIIACSSLYKFDNNNNNLFYGHIKIYKYNNNINKWIQMGTTIEHPDYVSNLYSPYLSFFGITISIDASGNKLAVGSLDYNNNNNNIFIYDYDINLDKWILKDYNIIKTNYYKYRNNDYSEFKLSKNGNTIVVNELNQIYIWYFDENNNKWNETSPSLLQIQLW